MDTFELDKISIAAINLSTATTLLGAFFEDYLEDAKHETLKFEAQHRPDMITAKISAVLAVLDEALLDIEMVTDPKDSPRVSRYLYKAKQLQERL